MSYMTVIADLHGRLPEIRPDSYMLLLAGDIAPDFVGHAQERAKQQKQWLETEFKDWINKLSIPVVAVPGNHDAWFWRSYHPALNWDLLNDGKVVEVEGLTIWGCGRTLDEGDYTGHATEFEFFELCETIPVNCDIILSHNPPLGICDSPSIARHRGSLALSMALYQNKAKLLVCGHCHEARGYKRFHQSYVVNATMGAGCNGHGVPIPAPFEPWGLSDNSWK